MVPGRALVKERRESVDIAERPAIYYQQVMRGDSLLRGGIRDAAEKR
jgi:hypothetical protein